MNNIIRLPDSVIWDPNSRKIQLAFDYFDNIITIDGLDYQLKYLNDIKGNKGGNSNVFILANPDEPDNFQDQLIIKICNLPIEKSYYIYRRRFDREQLALLKAKKAGLKRIIRIYSTGIIIIKKMRFPFYTMEKADWDLANYLNEKELDINQKLILILEIIEGFIELHKIKIYHRDIKHDNIFLIKKGCKIGDLGLMRFRDDDIKFTKLEVGDRIGAFGWESPEAMNKYLTEKLDSNKFDCEIDDRSDIFQLGKLFWFIYQGNLPIGQIKEEDFEINDKELFQVIFAMLQHSKHPSRRIQSLTDLKGVIKRVAIERNIL